MNSKPLISLTGLPTDPHRVTSLDDLLHFGQPIQSLWQQLFCPNHPHFQTIFVKVSKSFIFLVKSFLGNFYRNLATFYWSHCGTTYLAIQWRVVEEYKRHVSACKSQTILCIFWYFIFITTYQSGDAVFISFC